MRTATKTWFRAAGVRAVKTLAQTAAAMIGVGATIGTVDWLTIGSTAAVSAILSLLTSLAGLPETTVKEGESNNETNDR